MTNERAAMKETLKDAIRSAYPGGCKLLSQGNCECLLCLLDALTSPPAPSGWQQRIAAMEAEIAALRRENSVALCQSCTRLRAIARDSELFATIVYDLKTGEVRVDRADGQNAKDALPSEGEGVVR